MIQDPPQCDAKMIKLRKLVRCPQFAVDHEVTVEVGGEEVRKQVCDAHYHTVIARQAARLDVGEMFPDWGQVEESNT